VSLTGIGKSFKEGLAGSFDPEDIQNADAIAAVGNDSTFPEVSEPWEFDVEACRELAQAGYALVDDEVHKYFRWGDSSLQSPIKEEIESKWGELRDQKVAENTSIRDETRDRLEELGYI
jgi:hypothetical protein